MTFPRLISVDLRRIDKHGSGRIKFGDRHIYVVRIGRRHMIGHFNRYVDDRGIYFISEASCHEFGATFKRVWKFVYEEPKKKK